MATQVVLRCALPTAIRLVPLDAGRRSPIRRSPIRRSPVRLNGLFGLVPVVPDLVACGGGSGSTDPVLPPPAKADVDIAAVVTTLKEAGVDLTATGNGLTAALVAASGTTAGNDFDKALDTLQAKRATGAPGHRFQDRAGRCRGQRLAFLYRPAGGGLQRVSVTDAGGHLGLATRKVTNTLPAEGRVAEFWNINRNNNDTASSITDGKHTVRALNGAVVSFQQIDTVAADQDVASPMRRLGM